MSSLQKVLNSAINANAKIKSKHLFRSCSYHIICNFCVMVREVWRQSQQTGVVTPLHAESTAWWQRSTSPSSFKTTKTIHASNSCTCFVLVGSRDLMELVPAVFGQRQVHMQTNSFLKGNWRSPNNFLGNSAQSGASKDLYQDLYAVSQWSLPPHRNSVMHSKKDRHKRILPDNKLLVAININEHIPNTKTKVTNEFHLSILCM